MAVRLWLGTWLTLSIGIIVFALREGGGEVLWVFLMIPTICCAGSLPALGMLLFTIPPIREADLISSGKLLVLLLLLLVISALYGLILWVVVDSHLYWSMIVSTFFPATGILFACTLVSSFVNYKRLLYYFNTSDDDLPYYEAQDSSFILQNQNNIQMENDQTMQQFTTPEKHSHSNKVLIKAAITGLLTLIMLIPTVFITNMVNERELLQKEVVAEVSNKWSKAQTITGPYIVVPYNQTFVTKDNKTIVTRKNVVLLPQELQVNGRLFPEERKRSIYTVLLYKASLQANGNFKVKIPGDVTVENFLFNEAKLCIGVSDFKGIEEKVTVTYNGTAYDLTPGLPTNEIDETGLSSSIPLSVADFAKPLAFNLGLKIKGSEQLSFVPLSGNSTFSINSAWPNPSFDGSTLPSERQVSKSGFSAKWAFNKANLPFNTFLKDFKMNKESYSFGVSMVQPADQYAKTMRCVKYAILFIGLTFSLFFIVELMQQRPVHPVQYILVGLALVIFYTLLLSLSEFVFFDNAYFIAATATIMLITLYAKGHFASWKIAGLFALVLGMLYGFIFVLIRLADTALLVGSIGLFVVLAMVMYASRRVNWYHPNFGKNAVEVV